MTAEDPAVSLRKRSDVTCWWGLHGKSFLFWTSCRA